MSHFLITEQDMRVFLTKMVKILLPFSCKAESYYYIHNHTLESFPGVFTSLELSKGLFTKIDRFDDGEVEIYESTYDGFCDGTIVLY